MLTASNILNRTANVVTGTLSRTKTHLACLTIAAGLFTAQSAEADIAREVLIQRANQSRMFVKEHRQGPWLDLYTDGAIIEDPVGSGVHTKGAADEEDGFEAFWDAFIVGPNADRPNDVTFDISKDLASKDYLIRDATITTITAQDGLPPIVVNAHLVYHLVEKDSGSPEIDSMRAYWNLPEQTVQIIKNGAPGLKLMGKFGLNLLNHLKLSNTVHYAAGPFLATCGAITERENAEALFEIVDGTLATAKKLPTSVFSSKVTVKYSDDRESTVQEFAREVGFLQQTAFTEMIVAAKHATMWVDYGTRANPKHGFMTLTFSKGRIKSIWFAPEGAPAK